MKESYEGGLSSAIFLPKGTLHWGFEGGLVAFLPKDVLLIGNMRITIRKIYFNTYCVKHFLFVICRDVHYI